MVVCGMTDNGAALDEDQARRLFDLPATKSADCTVPSAVEQSLLELRSARWQTIQTQMTARNGQWFDTEIEKLDAWTDDRRAALKAELTVLEEALKEARKAVRQAPSIPDKLERQRAARTLETKHDEAWRAYDQASRELDRQKDAVLDDIGKRLRQQVVQEQLFVIRWQLN